MYNFTLINIVFKKNRAIYFLEEDGMRYYPWRGRGPKQQLNFKYKFK